MIRRNWVLLLICIFGFLTPRAQQISNPDFNIMHYSDENGLPQNSVKAIMKDNNGFIWLATEDGLVRFDGQHFYTFNRSVSSISSNRIYGLIPSLSDYNLTDKRFSAQIQQNECLKIEKDGSAKIDTYHKRNGSLNWPMIRELTGAAGFLMNYRSRIAKTNNHVPLIAPVGNNSYYVWSNDKIEYYYRQTRKLTVQGNFSEFFLIGPHPYSRSQNGAFLDHSASDKTRNLTGDILKDPAYFPNKSDYLFFWNNVSLEAYIYLNKKFYSLTRSANGSSLQTNLILNDFDFEEYNISDVYHDPKSGYLYLGSNTTGLYVLRIKDFQALRFSRKVADNAYYAQMPFSKTSVLTSQGHLLENNPLKPAYNSLLMSKINGKYYLAMNHDSTFWMINGHTLSKLDKTGSRILIEYNLPERHKALYLDPKGILWIGGENNVLYSLNTLDQNSKPRLIIKANLGEISCMFRLSDQHLLVGTKKGLFRFDMASEKLISIRQLQSFTIRSIYHVKGETWITTYGDGLYYLTNDKLVKLPLDKEQFLSASHCIVEDKNGYFWITTNKGLFQVQKKDLQNFTQKEQQSVFYLHYDKRHGFGSNEFNGGCQPCALTLSDQTISFPSMNGLVWFNPDEIRPELPDKEIFITEIELDGKNITADSLKNVPRNFKQLRISLATPYFNDRTNLRMEYALQKEGHIQTWLPVADELVIQIPSTSSGQHTLVIRKHNGFSKDNYSFKTLKINIHLAWYETWIFRVVFAAGLLLLFWTILKLRTTFLLKAERKRNLYRQYHINNQIVAAINHDIQTPLHFIGSSFTQIQNHLDKYGLADTYISKMSEETINTINYARGHTSNLLNYIKSQSPGSQQALSFHEVNVFDIVEHSRKLLHGRANHREIEIINQVARDFKVKSDDKLLSVIIQNLLDNAVKMSKSKIVISTRTEKDHRHIIIEDTGKGIPAEILEWLNVNYESYDRWLYRPGNPNHKGLGLIIVKDISILLRIRICAKSMDNQGSVVQLSFQV